MYQTSYDHPGGVGQPRVGARERCGRSGEGEGTGVGGQGGAVRGGGPPSTHRTGTVRIGCEAIRSSWYHLMTRDLGGMGFRWVQRWLGACVHRIERTPWH